ncbi:MAG: HDOD domain-containing protein [Desulfobacteraceae bacterium]|nr:HDOD domain-containing protein [Desulfobacteraceae bacterium]
MSLNSLDEQEIRYQVSQIRELPPLPQSVQRLIEIIHDEIDSTDELVSIIRYDQGLTAKVLRIANSAYYGMRGEVKTVSGAVVLIGLNQAKSICLCTLLMNMLSGGVSIRPIHREQLWKHAFATSRIAAQMARKRPWLNPEEAAILGLLHDVGKLVMAMYFSKQFNSIMEIASQRRNPSWCVELQFGLTHTHIGKYLASRWGFPELFQAVIEFHHTPDMCSSYKTEVRLIHLANILSNSRTYPELLTDKATLSYCRDLYISEEEWQEHQDSLGHIWPEVDQLWTLLG